MAITLSVVGIFYSNSSFNEPGAMPTVQQVMDYVVGADINFGYTSITATTPSGNNVIVNSISAYFYPDGPTGRTGTTYGAGTYQLTQSFSSPNPNPYSVWQYYLFDANGQRVPVTADTSFTAQTVEDGWTIVWRLVTICNGPTYPAARLRSTLPSEAQKQLGMV